MASRTHYDYYKRTGRLQKKTDPSRRHDDHRGVTAPNDFRNRRRPPANVLQGHRPLRRQWRTTQEQNRRPRVSTPSAAPSKQRKSSDAKTAANATIYSYDGRPFSTRPTRNRRARPTLAVLITEIFKSGNRLQTRLRVRSARQNVVYERSPGRAGRSYIYGRIGVSHRGVIVPFQPSVRKFTFVKRDVRWQTWTMQKPKHRLTPGNGRDQDDRY